MVYVIQVCWQLASRIRMERTSIPILLASCPQTCMTYTIAVCTVKNSWWWTEELSETRRVSFREQNWEISASSWFYYKEFVTMHDHINVRLVTICFNVTDFAFRLYSLLIILTKTGINSLTRIQRSSLRWRRNLRYRIRMLFSEIRLKCTHVRSNDDRFP